MRIYNKTLAEVFRDIPWPYKIVVVAGSAFILFTLFYVPYTYYMRQNKDQVQPPLVIRGHEANVAGVLDPDLAYDGNTYALVYTAVLGAPRANNLASEVFIASSPRQNCYQWDFRRSLFPARKEEIIGPDGATPVKEGVWRVETPTLVHDPGDPGREWKLYAYKYFWAGDVPLARLYGTIVYKYTDNPLTDSWSTEEWAFSASKNSPPYPYSQIVKTHLDTLHPSLREVYFYARPSVIHIDNTLVMTLSAFIQGRETVDRVVMIASKDHGNTWHYLGTPLRHDDLGGMQQGFTRLQGATLMVHKGIPLLAAVLGDARNEATGTYIFGFDNISKGRLIRDAATQAPTVLKHIPLSSMAPTNVGGGFATYDESCDTGVLASEFSGLTRRYEIFRTNKAPLDIE